MTEHAPPMPTAQFWDALYGQRDQLFSGNPNMVLVREAASLTPGTALDLGCGEGADAVWLALRGWRVTAVDVSTTALRRAADAARAAGVADRVDWQRHDLAESFPSGRYDLVSAQFFHSPLELPRTRILRSAASAVTPGGTLLVVGHALLPPWSDHPDADLPTAGAVLQALELPPHEWRLLLCETTERDAIGPDGQHGTLTDSVVELRRHTT